MQERFSKYMITGSDRPHTMYEYYVAGTGVFPFDMLRYDSAWPASGEDAAKMEWSFASPRGESLRSIRLRSYRIPTIARWASFLWSVGPNPL